MVKKVKWNKSASQQLFKIITYLETEASHQAAENFAKTVFDKIELLRIQPFMGQATRNDKVKRRLHIDKHNVLLYRIKGRVLTISGFFDSRQHPDKKPY